MGWREEQGRDGVLTPRLVPASAPDGGGVRVHTPTTLLAQQEVKEAEVAGAHASPATIVVVSRELDTVGTHHPVTQSSVFCMTTPAP